MHDISQLIKEDYNQTVIINGMSDELASRYEELNLLYGIEAGFNSNHQQNIEETFQSIVEGCSSFMSVGLACMIFPGNEPIVSVSDKRLVKGRLKSILNKLQGPLYSDVAIERETVVVNGDEVTDWLLQDSSTDFKYMLVPFFKSPNLMGGILVVVNENDKASFTNSDRKLCEVLGAEISKFIQSQHDSLTGLANLKNFQITLQEQIRNDFEQGRQSALLYIDVDQFMHVNELSGHSAGDVLLTQMANLLSVHIRKEDLLARIGGDEFTILLHNCPLDNALTIAEKITNEINAFRFVFKDKIFDVTVSVGLVMFGDVNHKVEDLLGLAESACFTAKELGRNQVRIYNKTDAVMNKRRDDVLWVSRIHNALEENLSLIHI